MTNNIEEKNKTAAPKGGEPPAEGEARSGERRPEDSGREDLEKKAAEYLAGWQRARADFLNYKKGEMERMGEFLKYAAEEIVLKLLPILDNFEIAARQNLGQDLGGQGKTEQIIQGFLQIKNQLEEFLKNQGVEEIKTAGEKFDLNFMEAVEKPEPAFAKATAGKEEIVLEEIQKGYKIRGRLLRSARVKVSK